MPETLTYSTTLSMLTCGECAIPFAIPVDLHKDMKKTGRRFWCPNGHGISYGESENDRLKARLESAQRGLAYMTTSRDAALDQAQTAELRRRAAKGQLTKIRNRVGNGVCPCCNRSFANLARHMAGQHPGYADADPAV